MESVSNSTQADSLDEVFVFTQKAKAELSRLIHQPGVPSSYDIHDIEDECHVVARIVSVGMISQSLRDSACDTASRLGLRQQVDVEMVKTLLESCYDSDIDFHLECVPRESLGELVKAAVRERLSILVRVMCEDTSKFHGIVYTILCPDVVEDLLSHPVPANEALVRDWILEEGFRSVVASCNRLTSHPKLVGVSALDGLKGITQRLLSENSL